MFKTAYNSTDQPVVIDDEGRTIGGHDFGTVDESSSLIHDAVAAGRIVLVDDVSGGAGVAKNAALASERTQKLNEELKSKPSAKGGK